MKAILVALCAGWLGMMSAACAGEKILIAGSGWNQIMLIDKSTGKSDWTYDIPKHAECNSVALTKDRNIFYANKRNARLVDRDKNIIWEYPAGQGEEIHTATQLDNGNLMLGIAGKPARFVELSPEGKELKQVQFDTEIKSVHGQFRVMDKTSKGTYIIALLGRKLAVELDDKGKILTEVPVSFPAFSIKELADGNWLLSGDGGNVQIVNPKTREIVRHINNRNLDGAKLLFATEAVMLKNGNILVSNWNGHSKDKTQPKLVEIDKDNKVVWKLESPENIRNISAVYVLGN